MKLIKDLKQLEFYMIIFFQNQDLVKKNLVEKTIKQLKIEIT